MQEKEFNEKEEEERNRAWLALIADFTADTTFHGVKYLFQAHEFFLRRSVDDFTLKVLSPLSTAFF